MQHSNKYVSEQSFITTVGIYMYICPVLNPSVTSTWH